MTKETITEWFSVQEFLPPENTYVLLQGYVSTYQLERNDDGLWYWNSVADYGPWMHPTDMWAFLDIDEEEMEDGD
jgi:hypothetical protein